MGHPAEPRQCASHGGIPDDRDLHTGLHILRISGALWRFIKGFANIACPLYDVLGKEVKMDPLDLPPEVREAIDILKRKVQSTAILVFPDFDKPFLLEMDASKEGLCSPRSRVMGITIQSPLEAAP